MQISNRPGVADLDPAELLAVQGGDDEADMRAQLLPPEDTFYDPLYWQFVAGVWKLITSPPIVTAAV